MKQGNGLIIFWTLKNPSFPECYFEADSGVMCLDIHPQHQHYIAAGFYDGSVAVFSTVDRKDGPLHRCTAKNGKHTDPVWQVRKYLVEKNIFPVVYFFAMVGSDN